MRAALKATEGKQKQLSDVRSGGRFPHFNV